MTHQPITTERLAALARDHRLYWALLNYLGVEVLVGTSLEIWADAGYEVDGYGNPVRHYDGHRVLRHGVQAIDADDPLHLAHVQNKFFATRLEPGCTPWGPLAEHGPQ